MFNFHVLVFFEANVSKEDLLLYYLHNKNKLILSLVKKLDARFLPLSLKHCFVHEDMIQASVRFPTFEASAVYEKIGSSFGPIDRVYIWS